MTGKKEWRHSKKRRENPWLSVTVKYTKHRKCQVNPCSGFHTEDDSLRLPARTTGAFITKCCAGGAIVSPVVSPGVA